MVQTCVGELIGNKDHPRTRASLPLVLIRGFDPKLIQKTFRSKSFLVGTISEGSWVTHSYASYYIDMFDNLRIEAF